jgi:hypothetical protein
MNFEFIERRKTGDKVHKQKCGLTQSEMDPCIFFRINKDENTNKVTGYLVAITWVDDCVISVLMTWWRSTKKC